MISEAIVISVGTVDLILTDDLKLQKTVQVEDEQEKTSAVDKWSMLVSSGQYSMPQINAGEW